MQPDSADKPFDYKSFLKNLTNSPGVYRMLDSKDEVLYVGKAKDLKRRVSSYFTQLTVLCSLKDRGRGPDPGKYPDQDPKAQI